MKITKTRETEQRAVALYEVSKRQDEEGERARKRIEELLFYFELIGAFTDDEHVALVKELYFSEENILVCGVRKKAKSVFMHERRLQTYRNKYCRVIARVLQE